MVPNARINSSQFMFFKALGNTFKAPMVPEASFAASVSDSFKICSGVILFPLKEVSSKFSNTKIPSPASSFKMFSKIFYELY